MLSKVSINTFIAEETIAVPPEPQTRHKEQSLPNELFLDSLVDVISADCLPFGTVPHCDSRLNDERLSHHEQCCSCNEELNQHVQPTQGIDLVFCYRLRVAGKSRGKNERDEQRIPTVTYRRNGKHLEQKHL